MVLDGFQTTVNMVKTGWIATVVGILILVAGTSTAQVSLGVYAGLGNVGNGGDTYALTSKWPTTATGGESKYAFFDRSSATTVMVNGVWEATPHFGAALLYRSTHFNSDAAHRSGSCTSIGIQFRINFISNKKKVIPFFQAAYMFSNSFTMHQEKATSSNYPTQTQPAFDLSFSSDLGVGGDLGIEIKLSQPFSVIVMWGVHGANLDNASALKTIQSLSWGAGVQAPISLDGVVWTQGSIGLKYYIGGGKKKRDF